MLRHLSDQEVSHAEAVEVDLDRFIERRAIAGKEEANATEAAWAASERKYAARRQAELRREWVEFHLRLEASHLQLAQENAAKAAQISESA